MKVLLTLTGVFALSCSALVYASTQNIPAAAVSGVVFGATWGLATWMVA